MAWTCEQQQAITTRGGHLIVSAAAGSGKTAVLVERVCHYLVHEKGDLSHLLVVTFTEAAANEMRQRIAGALNTRLAANPDDRHLTRQLALVQRAHISTIHSFCLWLLRRYFYRLDLDPAFRVMDEGEDRLLKLEVLQEMLESHYQKEAAGSPFYELVDRYSNQQGTDLEKLLLALHDFAQSQVFPNDWLANAAQAFDIAPDMPLEGLRWYGAVQTQAAARLQAVDASLRAVLRLIDQPGGPQHYRQPVESDLALVADLQSAVESGTWDAAVAVFSGLSFKAARAGKSQADLDDVLLKRVQDQRNAAKKELQRLGKELFCRSAAQLLADLRSLQAPVQALVQLVQEFSALYSQAKQARGLVNFSDLERFTLQLLLDKQSAPGSLQASETAVELLQQFDEVLCDEYQDINPVQDAILGLVAGEHTHGSAGAGTFLVGDVKQSIYRFRLAEPRIFLVRCRRAAMGQGTPINLAANFRCRDTVVQGVNLLFAALMTKDLGDVDYDNSVALIHRAEYPACAQLEPPVELVVLEGDPRLIDDARRNSAAGNGAAGESTVEAGGDGSEEPEADEESEDIDLTALEREATLIARRIRGLVSGTGDKPYLVWDKEQKAYRPVRYRDCVVLLRATQIKASQFMDIFQNEGVPLYAETGSGYFRAIEVETMLALLNIVDNPYQDLPLAGVLNSPLVGLDTNELADIRLAEPEGPFFGAVMTRANQTDDLGKRLTDFLSQLEVWRTRARRSSLADLIWEIYRATGFYDYCGGMPGGGQRQANLRALYDRARQFDGFARHGLVRFLEYISDLRAAGADLGTAPALGENEDVVRLMSIHKSKGLEFPVVFVCGLGTAFNQQDLKGSLIYDRELGLGPQVIDPEQHTRAHSLASLGVREVIRRSGLSEEMRILYVALTRARERLYLVGTVRDVASTLEKWHQVALTFEQQRMPIYQAVAAKCYLDWVGPVLCSQSGLVPLVPPDFTTTTQVGTAPGWRVTILPPAAVVQEFLNPRGAVVSRPSVEQITAADGGLDERVRERLERQITWQYPHAALTTMPARTTVTELKRREVQVMDPENPMQTTPRQPIFRRPVFLQEKGKLTGAEVGTATHLVLQHVPLSAPVTPALVATCVQELVARQSLTSKEAAAVDQGAIANFFAHDLGCRLVAAADAGRRVMRELPFSLAIPVPEGANEDTVMLQGVIDCLFEEPDGWVLLDFKTDHLYPVDDAAVKAKERYTPQVQWYARAAAQVLGIPIKSCHIYLLTHRLVVDVDPVGV